jgi:hypothetical protein
VSGVLAAAANSRWEKQKGLIYLALRLGPLTSRKRYRKRVWCKSWLFKKDIYSEVNLFKELTTTAKGDYQNYLRIYEETFDLLLSKISTFMRKRYTNMKEATLPIIIIHMIGVP